ncbi:hypothetical protein MF451_003756 [Salmonella enterica subsp. enterica serovar Saintpaul]|nr:hypothetical protein [Salmonella enterica subsp. enterica serovar Saintpaul]
MRITSLSEFQRVVIALMCLDFANSEYMRHNRRHGSPTVKRAALAKHAAAIVRHDRFLIRGVLE